MLFTGFKIQKFPAILPAYWCTPILNELVSFQGKVPAFFKGTGNRADTSITWRHHTFWELKLACIVNTSVSLLSHNQQLTMGYTRSPVLELQESDYSLQRRATIEQIHERTERFKSRFSQVSQKKAWCLKGYCSLDVQRIYKGLSQESPFQIP